MIRIDSHCHVWQLSRDDYDWLAVDDPQFKSIARDFDVNELEATAAKADISKFVLVQAAATENETEYLLSIAGQFESIVGVVGWVDLSDDIAAQSIQRLSSNPLFKGIRPMLQDIKDTQWLLDVPDPKIWTLLSKSGLRFDALVQPRHLPMLHQFCQRYVDLPVVIDHAAKPKIANGSASDFEQWRMSMSKLARETNAYCKLSGLLTEMGLEQIQNAVTLLQPYVDHLLEAFGPERLMWGSDWPVVRMAGDYTPWNDLTFTLLRELNDQDKNAILSSTACNFYGIKGVVS